MVHLQPSFLSLTIGIPIAVVLSGLVLAITVCLFMAACLWKREKNELKKEQLKNFSSKPAQEEDMNGYASETSTVWSAYEPLNSVRSKGTTLSKLSPFPKYKGVDKLKPTEPSPYHQQRYCEAPTGRFISNHVSLTSPYETSDNYERPGVPTLPPRPSRFSSFVTYPSTFLRPILCSFAPQAVFPSQRYISSHSEFAYTTLTSDDKK